MANREYHVNSVRMSPTGKAHEHITHIGNNRANWVTTREAAIKWIESDEVAFYTADVASGKKMYLKVVKGGDKPSFLRTHADGEENDHLLKQEPCGADCRLIG